MKGEITRKYLVHYPKSMIGKQVTGYDRSSLLGGCILPRVQDGEGASECGYHLREWGYKGARAALQRFPE